MLRRPWCLARSSFHHGTWAEMESACTQIMFRFTVLSFHIVHLLHYLNKYSTPIHLPDGCSSQLGILKHESRKGIIFRLIIKMHIWKVPLFRRKLLLNAILSHCGVDTFTERIWYYLFHWLNIFAQLAEVFQLAAVSKERKEMSISVVWFLSSRGPQFSIFRFALPGTPTGNRMP